MAENMTYDPVTTIADLRAQLAAAQAQTWRNGGVCPECRADAMRESLDNIGVDEGGCRHLVRYCRECGAMWIEPVTI